MKWIEHKLRKTSVNIRQALTLEMEKEAGQRPPGNSINKQISRDASGIS